MNAKIRAIAKRIKDYNTIVISRHVGPDPDAIASQIALRDAIRLRYPSKNVYAVGTPVSKFKSYGTLDKINDEKLDNSLLFVLDCPNISRVDGVKLENFTEVIKIDHHPFEDKMGEIEWVDTEASSTCEMITELLISARFRANRSIAENLFIGVVADSDRFLFSSPGGKTLELMSILIKNSKIDISTVYPRLYLRPLNEVKFQAYITEHLKVTASGFASLKIDKKIIDKYKVDAGTASNLVNNFNNIKEILCWALVSYDEKLQMHKINIRSRGPAINEVASKFNGGGHAHASGARLKTQKEIDKLFKELDKTCKEYKKQQKDLQE
ncbi:MAG: bifunctional oligoribonuclease/PAP phosphatase NrnA [Bacilli bacterium]|nr:bifunctional oligoribonuclease/PAP phosphatase NrnA [Bacilli bacterium]